MIKSFKSTNFPLIMTINKKTKRVVNGFQNFRIST